MSIVTETIQRTICDQCEIEINEQSNYYYISPGEDCSIGGGNEHIFITDTLHFCCKAHLIDYICKHVD